MKHIMMEMTGRQNPRANGRGGSMHMFKPEANYFGGVSSMTSHPQTSLGAGLAFAHKYKGDGNVAITMYGDGAANKGQLFEAYNMAALWKLPAIFVCEDNKYCIGTSKARASYDTDFYRRGDYVPGIKVDGMNVLAVREAVRFAKAHALEDGPIVLELDTYRYHGFSMADPGITYRSREEVQSMAQDARIRLSSMSRHYLEDFELATAAEIKEIEAAVRREIDEAVEVAKKTPPPLYRHLVEPGVCAGDEGRGRPLVRQNSASAPDAGHRSTANKRGEERM